MFLIRKIQKLVRKDMQKAIAKLTCYLTKIKLRRQVKELSRQVMEMKKRKLEEHEKIDHRSITSFENSFQSHEHSGQLLDQDEYREDFDDLICDEINMDWYSPSIHDVYFDNYYVDNNII